jgi:ATP-dependent protease ClpP protease subunit
MIVDKIKSFVAILLIFSLSGLTYYQLFKTRTDTTYTVVSNMNLPEVIEKDNVADLITAINSLQAGQKMILHINSRGGSVLAGNQVDEAIDNCKGAVEGEVDGMAASMAAVILMHCQQASFHGDKTEILFHVVRFINPLTGEVIIPNDEDDPNVKAINAELRKTVEVVLEPSELNTIFKLHRDFWISGADLQTRLCTKVHKAC